MVRHAKSNGTSKNAWQSRAKLNHNTACAHPLRIAARTALLPLCAGMCTCLHTLCVSRITCSTFQPIQRERVCVCVRWWNKGLGHKSGMMKQKRNTDTQTRTHTLTLSLTHTHAHSHTHSLSVSLVILFAAGVFAGRIAAADRRGCGAFGEQRSPAHPWPRWRRDARERLCNKRVFAPTASGRG